MRWALVPLVVILLASCGSRGSLFGGPGEETEVDTTNSGGAASGGADSTGGTEGIPEDPCQDPLDLNAGPGDWLTQLRIAPAPVDGFSVSLPTIVATNHGVNFAFTLGPPLGLDEPEGFIPGLMFAHSVGSLDATAGQVDFRLELVDPRSVGGGSLATDGDAYFISYQSSDGLRLATRTPGEDWVIEIVDPVGSSSDGARVSHTAVGGDGSIHIAYKASSDLRYAKKEGGVWSVETIASLNEPFQVPDLRVDEDGTPHVVWVQASSSDPLLMYASRQGGWQAEAVETPVPAHDAALEVSRDGIVHVAFLSRSSQANPRFLGRRRSDGWEFEEIDTTPDHGYGYISFDLDADDFAHVLIDAATTTYVTNRSGTWESESVLMSTDDGTSLVVDAAGAVHAVSRYFNYPNNVAPQYTTNRTVTPDGLDQNCDGVDGIDADGDGRASIWTGGSDCDDFDPSTIDCAPE